MGPWFWYLIAYSFLGWVTERVFAAVTHSPVQRRRCLLVSPLCPVYGIGMTLLLALPAGFRQGMRLFFSGAVTATAVEYGYHWACETLLGVRFWDYSHLRGNLRGRVCLPFSLAWGVLTAAAVRLVHPVVAAAAMQIPPAVTLAALLFFAADTVCSIRFLLLTHDIAAMRSIWTGKRREA